MKKIEKVRNNNQDHEYKQMAFRQQKESHLYPTLVETQMQDLDHQIDMLYIHLKAHHDSHFQYYERLTMEEKEELLAEQGAITMNISLMKEERSRIYESMGEYADALRSLVEASESLFEKDCDLLNSLMGKGYPHETRLYELDDRCKELCNRHPELWEQYHNSIMKYLLGYQHLWPCER